MSDKQVLDGNVLKVRCGVCRTAGDRARSLGTIRRAGSGEGAFVAFVPLRRVDAWERWDGDNLAGYGPVERVAAELADADLTEDDRGLLRERTVEAAPRLVGAEWPRLRCWAGHSVGPAGQVRARSLYLDEVSES